MEERQKWKLWKRWFFFLCIAFLIFASGTERIAEAGTINSTFSGTTIDTSFWTEIDTGGAGGTAGNVQQNNALTVLGNNNWGTEGFQTASAYDRSSGNLTLEVDAKTTSCSAGVASVGLGYGDFNIYANPGDSYVAFINNGILYLVSLHNGGITQTVNSGFTCTSNTSFHLRLVILQAGGADLYINGASSPNASVTGGTFTNKSAFLQSYGSGATATYANFSISGTGVLGEPDAPAGLQAQPADGQATLSWTTPVANGSAITDYVIQYRYASNTFATFNDGVSVATSTVITGLTNGLLYDLRVAAVNVYGTSTYSATTTAMPISAAPSAPSAIDLSINGSPDVGTQLTGSYVYDDSNGDVETGSIYRWLKSDTQNGSYVAISSATSSVYTPTMSDLGKYIKFEVTPISSASPTVGSTTTSASVFIEGELPSSVSGLALWLKADAINGLSDGQAVSSWVDSSSNGNNAVQATGVNQPLYQTNIQNGKPIVRFDGTNDYLSFTRISNIRTAFFVVKWSGSYNSYAPLLGDPTYYDFHGGASNMLFDSVNASSSILNGSLYINGSSTSPLTATKPLSTSVLTITTAGDARASYVTNDRSAAGRYWRGDYAEVILFNGVLSDADRRAIEFHLSNKYGITYNGVTSAPINIAAVAQDGAADLSWDAPDEGNVSPITDYTIQYRYGSNAFATYNDGVSVSTSTAITGLTNGLSYDFKVAAVNAYGTSVYSATTTATPITATPVAPGAVGLSITGSVNVNEQLTGIYAYADPNGDPEASSIYRWLESDTVGGTYLPISGATGTTYIIQQSDLSKYIKFEVTPISSLSPTTGVATLTSAVGPVGVEISYINHILSTGQSLALGSNGSPALTTSQPYQNVKLSGASLVPLVESGVETISSAMANFITANVVGNTFKAAVTINAQGATAYTGLKKGTTPYNTGISNVTSVQTAAAASSTPYRVIGVTTIHGESDHLAGTTQTQYEADLVEWQNDYNTDIKAITGQATDIPLFTDQMSSQTGYGNATSVIPLAQLAASEDYPNTIVLVGPKYIFNYSDVAHLTNTSYRWLGEYYGKVIKKVIVDHQAWTPLKPSRIVRSGNAIYAQFSVPTAPLVFDATTVAQRTNNGFEYADDSSSASISSVQLLSADTVKVTLNTSPTGLNQHLRYAYTGTPNVQPGASNAGAVGGNLRDSDSTASQYGNTLYNWSVQFDKPMTVDETGPIISNVSSSNDNTTASISWTTDESGSTKTDLGVITGVYASSTQETDTAGVLGHADAFTQLVPCTTYHYRVRSKDFAQNEGVGSDASFTTLGCTGSASVLAQSATSVSALSGGSASLVSGTANIALTVPASFSSQDATFQVKQLDPISVTNIASAPVNYSVIGDHAYQLEALTGVTSTISSFSQPITVTMTYAPSEVTGYYVTGLKIYHWNGASWSQLSGCVVDTNAHTVACQTSSFSTFGLFGQSIVATPASVTAANVSTTRVDVQWTDQSNNEVGFLVDQSTDGVSYASVTTTAANTTSTTVTGLSPNTVYWFRVAAFDASSNTSTYATTATGTHTLASTPSMSSITVDGRTQITVSVSTDASLMYVENITAGMNSGWISSTSTIFTNLTCGTQYGFRVKGRNGDAVETSWSDTSYATSTECASLPTQSGGGGTSASSYTIPISALPQNVSGQTISLPLDFTINNGLSTTQVPAVTITFNANPQTVRGYALSLDPTLKDAPLLPYVSSTLFELPDGYGTYTLYARYYSLLGNPSDLLSHSISYTLSSPIASAPTATTMTTSSMQLPLKTLRLPAILRSFVFRRVLQVGDRGVDVKALQIFLNSQGFIIAKTGPGSPGKENGSFGLATKQALIRFQEAHAAAILKPQGLKKGTGKFGGSTRAFVNAVLTSGKFAF